MGALVELAKQVATKYRLDPALVCALCEQESSWRPWAIRYEAAFQTHYVDPLPNLTPTERSARATSWGLMQVLGQVARECGFEGVFLSELCDPMIGLEFGCRKLLRCITRCVNVHDALQRYNGGANPHYADEVLARLSKYQGA